MSSGGTERLPDARRDIDLSRSPYLLYHVSGLTEKDDGAPERDLPSDAR
jgi:hypothetical protein